MVSSSNALSAQMWVEESVCLGKAAQLLEALADSVLADLTPERAFAIGRAAEEEERFELAASLFQRARAGDDVLRARSAAHLAHLDYYAGRPSKGLRRLEEAASVADPLARAEISLYRSVNLITLNRSRDALEAAITAQNVAQRVRNSTLRRDLRFRVFRQLVHVFVARGEYVAAAAEAEGSYSIARRIGSPSFLALASYLRGFVSAARGDGAAMAHFEVADRSWGGREHAFGRWLAHVWATVLRDRGDPDGANRLRARAGIAVPWEEPLFEIAVGRRPALLDVDHCPADEQPFRLAANGLLLWVAGQPELAERALIDAADEFRRAELRHYERGVNLMLAAALSTLEPERAGDILRRETGDVARFDLQRWPWWHPQVVTALSVLASRLDIAPDLWRRRALARRGSLGVAQTLEDAGLTAREANVVAEWLGRPGMTRAVLAAHLSISEATVRNHLNSARRKLSCGSRRGVEALIERIEARARSH